MPRRTRVAGTSARLTGIVLAVLVMTGCSGQSKFQVSSRQKPQDTAADVSPGEGSSSALPGAPNRGDDNTIGEPTPPGVDPVKQPEPVPELKAVFTEVPRDTLGPAAEVAILWEPEDRGGSLSGWLAQVDVKPAGATEWMAAGVVPAGDKKLLLTWGDRSIGPFETRVTLVRDAERSNTLTATWSPHIFSAAILTRSVKCLFCHIRVEGDVGGIDFPLTDMHKGSATGARILGKLFATGGVPAVFKTGVPGGTPVATQGFVENYKNEGKKIFPKSNSEGIITFPILSKKDIEPKMVGTLVTSSSPRGAVAQSISKVHKGTLFVDGTETPFVIKGEVLIDGDLVIRGSFRGQGTIYADNIYVIGDVTAERSPFPFAIAEDQAMEQARASLLRGDDALYLAAMNQIWVGETQTPLRNASEVIPADRSAIVNLFGSEAKLVAAAQKPLPLANYRNATPDIAAWNFNIEDKFRMDVSRVDAFLFATDGLVWHGHGNWLLNGGFVSPKAAMTSALQKATGRFWCDGQKLDLPDAVPNNCGNKKALLINPRNGLPSHTNVVRFDYRLRAGGTGFESIRNLFE